MPQPPEPPSGAPLPTAPDAGPAGGGAVKSAERALQVLEFFDARRREARAREIAEAIGMPQSSASMLLKSLTARGYLDYDEPTRTYLPSPRVTLLGSWLDGGPVRDGSLLRAVEFLAERTSNAVFVAARNGIYARYIHVTPARTTMRFDIPLGSRRLLVRSAAGFVLLARAPDEEIRALVRRTNAELGGGGIPEEAVLASVREARDAGRCFSRGLVTPGAGALAMALPEGIDRGGRPLALCTAGVLEDFERREAELIAEMREAIARFLG